MEVGETEHQDILQMLIRTLIYFGFNAISLSRWTSGILSGKNYDICIQTRPSRLNSRNVQGACAKGGFTMLLSVPPHRALPGMMQWIRSQRPGESGINIITADFVELGEFISAVITLNYHLDDDEDDAT